MRLRYLLGGDRPIPHKAGLKSGRLCKSRRELDCETYKSNRDQRSVLVIRRFCVEGPSLNGYKLL